MRPAPEPLEGGPGNGDKIEGHSLNLRTNADRLIAQRLTGEVSPSSASPDAYRVDADGHAFILPGMGAVTLGVHPGDPAVGWIADHLEPGASIWHPDPDSDHALQAFTCVGNCVTLRAGPRAGATGRVIGQHAYVLADFDEEVLQDVGPGDGVVIDAVGQGLRLVDHPQVVVKNSSPELLEAMGAHTDSHGRLALGVSARVPTDSAGAGTGMIAESANMDLMGACAERDSGLSLGLESLRIGDVVLLESQDHSFGRGWRDNWCSIGVVATGDCRLFGHGPGVTTLLTGPVHAFALHDDPHSSLLRAFLKMDRL